MSTYEALADRVVAYVTEHGTAREADLIEATGQARPFVRGALELLAPAPPETKKPSPRAGTLVVDEKGVWRFGTLPPPPRPEPIKCTMTADGAHVPSANPLRKNICEACARVILPTDPIRKGYAVGMASVRASR